MATLRGGGLANQASAPALVNCIVWGNHAWREAEMSTDPSSSPLVKYSDVDVGHSGVYTGEENINADPLFVKPLTATVAPTTAGDYRLLEGSPAVDAGYNDVVSTETDLGSSPRLLDGDGDGTRTVDMGAYEFQVPFLTIIKEGQGVVTSTSGMIDCGGVCSAGILTGTHVTLTAAAEQGWTFNGWSGGVTTTTNPAVLTMEGEETVTATFEINTYVITPTVGSHGVITPSAPQTVDHGDAITFTIGADPGYEIADVAVDGVSQGAIETYTFTNVTTDHTISASFKPLIRPRAFLPLVSSGR